MEKGGEGYVFKFGNGKVVKIYSKSTQEYVAKLKSLQERLSEANLPYATPLIENIGEVGGIQYSIEKKLEGQNLESLFSKLSAEQQSQVIHNYLTALKPLRDISVADLPFGQIIDQPNSLHATSWKTFLLNKLHQKIALSQERISHDVNNFPLKLLTLENMIQKMLQRDPQKTFVHGDYYFTNVLVNESLEISAVLDISEHTCVGDYRLDVANINFMPLCTDITQAHIDLARNIVIEEYGNEIIPFLDMYGFYYAFYFSNLYTFVMTSYQWCLGILNDDKRWAKYY
ncbi:phosphotransferase [Candidatus Woesebacteria bacterium]|nr:phosphotransferase [Candidatus Woesebacteria bacterium]